MDKINKFLLKLTKKERAQFSDIFKDIYFLNLKTYDIKLLKEMKGVFRLRKGDIRVVFTKAHKKGVILDIAYRKDIYKK